MWYGRLVMLNTDRLEIGDYYTSGASHALLHAVNGWLPELPSLQ